MVSRSNAVNLSNMPVLDERPYTGSAVDWEEGKTTGKTAGKTVGKLLKTLKTELKTTSEGESEGWKVTRFDKTPLVRLVPLSKPPTCFVSVPSPSKSCALTMLEGFMPLTLLVLRCRRTS